MAAETVGRHKVRVREDFDETYDDEVMAHELSEQEIQAWEEYERQAWEEYERQALAEYRRKKLVEEDFKE